MEIPVVCHNRITPVLSFLLQDCSQHSHVLTITIVTLLSIFATITVVLATTLITITTITAIVTIWVVL